MSYKVSIVIPVYKAREYIAQCAESLFQQDLDSIEYIFINDCTPDDSIEVLEAVISRYQKRYADIKIIHNKENKGSGYTRKKGVEVATGEYIIHIDSDDWVEPEMCSRLYLIAKDNEADIVSCDYFYNIQHKQTYISQKYSEDPMLDFKSILLGRLHGSLCNKLVKRDLYIKYKIFPPEEFSLYEDKITTLQLFFHANKIAYIPEAFLHYRQHQSSMTSVLVNDKQVRDTLKFIDYLHSFFIKNDLIREYKDEFYSCVLYHKKAFMLDEKYYTHWDSCFPEANKIRYVFGIELYDWKKKLVTIIAMVLSKRIMEYCFGYYKRK